MAFEQKVSAQPYSLIAFRGVWQFARRVKTAAQAL
jgi:hypothetical protein